MDTKNNDVVPAQVRLHISSLVFSLGGASADDGRYKLGNDAHEVLRDLKRWIRLHDEETGRMDVARCLAEANVVGSDLLPIVALWRTDQDDPFMARVALACFEIMVPLTWPLAVDPACMTVNHHRHVPVLQLAQLKYKKLIVSYHGTRVLHAAVRTALPAIALPMSERSSRDRAVIKLMLLFIRNVAMIARPPGAQYDAEELLVSRSATIDAFAYQDIFLALLTIASNMGDDFRTEDVLVMETIFHLVKGIDPAALFLDDKRPGAGRVHELKAMLQREKARLPSHQKHAPTRHNRFGSMVWVKRDDGKMVVVSGQRALLNASAREAKMDSLKTFQPPRRAKRDAGTKNLGSPVSLNVRTNRQLRAFVEEFLDSGFNPLFQHVRKSLTSEAPHVLGGHHGAFFHSVAWFLGAERERRNRENVSAQKRSADDVRSFNLVAGVINQEMFCLLSQSLHRCYDEKDWATLTPVMRCFSQILLTVQDVYNSRKKEDRSIAKNMLARLFYEESTHDVVINVVRRYNGQGFEYLDAVTELAHIYIRILESYSKLNADLQVRAGKRTRKRKASPAGSEGEQDDIADKAQRAGKERKLNFKHIAARFATQGVVDAFVRFAAHYHELDDEQLKRAHRYFYRVAFKNDMAVMLFRVDILHLLYTMVKGPDPLDPSSVMREEWEELVRQIIKKCLRKLDQRPALFVEMLFSKTPAIAHYLEYG